MDKKTKSIFTMLLAISWLILAVILLYYPYPWWVSRGVHDPLLDKFVRMLWRGRALENEILVRIVCLVTCLVSLVVQKSGNRQYSMRVIAPMLLAGAFIFVLLPFVCPSGVLYVLFTIASYTAFLTGSVMLGRYYNFYGAWLPSYHDTFPQCEKLISSDLSVNLPMTYRYQGQKHHGYINVVSPQRGCLVLGTPGSGKSYSIYGPFIRQMMQKQYTMFVYDYKYPDLTRRVMNELINNYDCYKVKPKMYIVNFDEPLYSHRFNPIHPRYLKDAVDATEIAELILRNVNRGNGKEGDNFFDLSSRCFVDLLISYLSIYEGGKYCSFPYLIELMGQDYKTVFQIMQHYPQLTVKLNTFVDAIKDKAVEQLQGQIASARVALNRFASKTLYWILSGDDFSLDINNPEEPKIICVGNNPRRQNIYGTTLALLTAQLFKQINVPGKQQSAVLIDELPTIYLKGLDNLIDTARSNKVAVVIGAQDKSQLIRDYDMKESAVIFNTVGNVFAGAVKNKTAEMLSKSFGKEERETRSVSQDENGERTTYSYQLRDVMPMHKIEALSQGTFCGYVADTIQHPIHPKIFCGQIDAGNPPVSNMNVPQIVDMTQEAIEREIDRNYEKIRADIAMIIRTEQEILEF